MTVAADPSSNNFLREFVQLAYETHDSGKVGAWLLDNARRMRQEMFFDRQAAWNAIEPMDLLALRACAPAGVFTQVAKGAFLSNGDTNELADLANAVFEEDDYLLFARLPTHAQRFKPQIVQLMQLAYKAGIKDPNPRVKLM